MACDCVYLFQEWFWLFPHPAASTESTYWLDQSPVFEVHWSLRGLLPEYYLSGSLASLLTLYGHHECSSSLLMHRSYLRARFFDYGCSTRLRWALTRNIKFNIPLPYPAVTLLASWLEGPCKGFNIIQLVRCIVSCYPLVHQTVRFISKGILITIAHAHILH